MPAKLYFRYGAVGSAKTMNLLAVAHNYTQQGKKVLLIKPALDNRFGANVIQSRCGLTAKADIVVAGNQPIALTPIKESGASCLLVDEAQFLSAHHIDQFREIADQYSIPVICYGLRTDFKTQLFEGARRLMEIADAIEEVKTTCFYCNRKGTANLKLCDGQATLDGPQVQLGTEETYVPTCFWHYYQKTKPISTNSAPGTPDTKLTKSRSAPSSTTSSPASSNISPAGGKIIQILTGGSLAKNDDINGDVHLSAENKKRKQ